jgi:hypothetical protein
VTISAGLHGFELVVGNNDNKRSLDLRDAQHEYMFIEVTSSARATP